MPVARSRQSLSAKMWEKTNKDIAFSIFQFFQNDVFSTSFIFKKSSSFTIYTFSKIFLTNFQQCLEKLVKLLHQLSKLKHLCRRFFFAFGLNFVVLASSKWTNQGETPTSWPQNTQLDLGANKSIHLFLSQGIPCSQSFPSNQQSWAIKLFKKSATRKSAIF